MQKGTRHERRMKTSQRSYMHICICRSNNPTAFARSNNPVHRPQKTTSSFSTVQKASLTGLFVRGKRLRYVVFTAGYRVFMGDMQFSSEKDNSAAFCVQWAFSRAHSPQNWQAE